MTRIVNGLEVRGYVARRPDPATAGSAWSPLTASGREVILANRRAGTSG